MITEELVAMFATENEIKKPSNYNCLSVYDR